MSFEPARVADFLRVFHESKHKIRASEGCERLELLNDVQHPHVFFTYSHWISEEHLNRYRFSELFKSVWVETKPLFNEKAQAWSLETQASL